MAKSTVRKQNLERVFTVELNSGTDLKKVNIQNGTERVLVEGTIGVLKRAAFVEGTVLEVAGTDGVLRVDLSKERSANGKAITTRRRTIRNVGRRNQVSNQV